MRSIGPVRRSGFSLVEVLVVLGILSLLIAMLLPAVQSSRAAARRTLCQNNLRQIGQALHNYHEQHSLFPPAVVWGGPLGEPLGGGSYPVGLIDRVAIGRMTASDPDRAHANWLVLLLPSLDQGALWNAFDSDRPISDPNNLVVRETRLSVLACPDDSFNTSPYIRDQLAGGSTNRYARGNYAMNFGPGKSCLHESDPNCENGFHVDDTDLLSKNGVFWGSGIGGVNRSFAMKEILRGQSQFVIVDEIRAGVHPVDPRGSWALGYIGASLTARHGVLEGGEDANGPNNQSPSSDDIVGCNSMTAQIGVEELKRLQMPCWSQTGGNQPELNGQATARSMHPGGVFVLTGDGGSHFISDLINPEVWFYLHSRDSSAAFDSPF